MGSQEEGVRSLTNRGIELDERFAEANHEAHRGSDGRFAGFSHKTAVFPAFPSVMLGHILNQPRRGFTDAPGGLLMS